MKKKYIVYVLGSILIALITCLLTYYFLVSVGVLQVQNLDITIMTPNEEITYDGLPHSFNEASITSGKLKDGHQIEYFFSNEIKESSSIENRVTAKIVDSQGYDVTSNYTITYNYGQITMQPRTIYLTYLGDTLTYDGLLHEVNKEDISYQGVLEEDTFTILNVDASLKDAGKKEIIVDWRVTNSDGVDISQNYNPQFKNNSGFLLINQKKIQVKGESLAKTFDGTSLCSEDLVENVKIYGGHLLEGDTISSVHFFNQIKNVGALENEFEITIINSLGEDVTSNYEIEITTGTLEVLEYEMDFLLPDIQYTYDGTLHKYSDVLTKEYNGYLIELYASGEALDYSDDGKISYNSVVTLDNIDMDESGFLYKDNFKINVNKASISILKRTIKFNLTSINYIFDGTKPLLSSDEYRENIIILNPEDIVEGEIYTYNLACDELKKDVGSYKLDVDLKVYDSSNKDTSINYEIEKNAAYFNILNPSIEINYKKDLVIEYADETIYNETPLDNINYLLNLNDTYVDFTVSSLLKSFYDFEVSYEISDVSSGYHAINPIVHVYNKDTDVINEEIEKILEIKRTYAKDTNGYVIINKKTLFAKIPSISYTYNGLAQSYSYNLPEDNTLRNKEIILDYNKLSDLVKEELENLEISLNIEAISKVNVGEYDQNYSLIYNNSNYEIKALSTSLIINKKTIYIDFLNDYKNYSFNYNETNPVLVKNANEVTYLYSKEDDMALDSLDYDLKYINDKNTNAGTYPLYISSITFKDENLNQNLEVNLTEASAKYTISAIKIDINVEYQNSVEYTGSEITLLNQEDLVSELNSKNEETLQKYNLTFIPYSYTYYSDSLEGIKGIKSADYSKILTKNLIEKMVVLYDLELKNDVTINYSIDYNMEDILLEIYDGTVDLAKVSFITYEDGYYYNTVEYNNKCILLMFKYDNNSDLDELLIESISFNEEENYYLVNESFKLWVYELGDAEDTTALVGKFLSSDNLDDYNLLKNKDIVGTLLLKDK